jgi:hypothetical protein
MSTGSGATRVLAVLLFTAAILFAAGAVPSLATHSPGGGLENVSEGAAAGGSGGPASSALGDGVGGDAVGTGGSAPGVGGQRPAAGSAEDLTVPERVATLFGSLLEAFGGGPPAAPGGPGGTPTSVDTSDVSRGTAEATPTAAGGTPTPPDGRTTPTAEPTATSADDEGGLAGGGSRRMGLAVAVVAALVVGVYLYRSDRGPLAALRALPDRMRAVFVGLLLAVSTLVERAVSRLAEVRSVLELPGVVAAAVREALRSLRADVAGAVPFTGGGAGTAAGAASTGEEASRQPARQQIREAWRDVVETVAPGRYRTATPGEIERDAVDRGLPAAAVRALADAFRAVEYGDRDADDRVASATDAAATLRDHVDDEEGE